jgi:hypothetical protein
VAKYKSVQTTDEDAKEREQKNERKLIYFQDQDDMWVIHAKLPPEAGALVVKAIEAVATPVQLEKQQQLQEPQKSVSAETSVDVLRHAAPVVDAKTCIPHWQGEDCDYGMRSRRCYDVMSLGVPAWMHSLDAKH